MFHGRVWKVQTNKTKQHCCILCSLPVCWKSAFSPNLNKHKNFHNEALKFHCGAYSHVLWLISCLLIIFVQHRREKPISKGFLIWCLPFVFLFTHKNIFQTDILSPCGMKHRAQKTLALGVLERLHHSVPVTNHLPHSGGSCFHRRVSLSDWRIDARLATNSSKEALKGVCALQKSYWFHSVSFFSFFLVMSRVELSRQHSVMLIKL